MQRRKFIQQGGLLGLVLASGPVQGALNLVQKRPRLISLPDTEHHVRHGGWKRPGKFAWSGLPQLKRIQRNVYFANGCEASGKDLVQIRWQWDREWLQCCATPSEVYLSDGYHTQSLQPGNEPALMRWPNGLQAEFIQLEQVREWQTASRSLVLAFESGVTWEGQVLSMDEALVVPQGSRVSLQGEGRVLVLSASAYQA